MTEKVYDWHCHSIYSYDVDDQNATIYNLAQVSLQEKINIGIVDHFDYSVENSRLFSEEHLESIISTKKKFDLKVGLEVGYEPENERYIFETLDQYTEIFDYYLVSVHQVAGYDTSLRKGLIKALKQYPFVQVKQKYYKVMKQLILSAEQFPWNGICHFDVIYKYVNDLVVADKSFERDTELYRLGKLAINQNLPIEINLGGLRTPVKRILPAPSLIDKLVKIGSKFFVGSDSHSLSSFEENIPLVKSYNSDYKVDIVNIIR